MPGLFRKEADMVGEAERMICNDPPGQGSLQIEATKRMNCSASWEKPRRRKA